MLHFSIQNLTIQTTGLLLILANSSGVWTTLNSLDGINLFYNLTTKTFDLDIFCLTLLVFFFRTSPPKTTFILFILLFKINLSIPEYYNIINYTKSNTGLINPLGQYHPPLLFIFILTYLSSPQKTIYLYIKNSKINTRQVGLWTLSISFFLSMWWAIQELFWGGYWNWDPVELSLLLFALVIVLEVHLYTKKTEYLYTNALTPAGRWVFVFIYIINRGPLANSVHAFSNSFFLNIDRIWYEMLLMLVIAYLIMYSANAVLKPQIYIKQTAAITLITLIGLLVTTMYIILYEVFFKNLFKSEIFLGFIITLLLLGLIKFKKLYVTKSHVLVLLTISLLFIINEAPTNDLYLKKLEPGVWQTALTDQYILKSNFTNNQFTYWLGYWKIAQKHYSSSTATYNFALWAFAKYNNLVSFFFLDNQDCRKCLWILFYLLKNKTKPNI